MSATAVKVGIDCKIYRNTGTHGGPTWNEITTARDVTLSLTKGKADASSRASRWKMSAPAMKEASIDLELLEDPSVDDYDVLRDAYINDTILDLAFADGPIATVGTEYFRADYFVSDFPIAQPLEDSGKVAIKLELAYSANAPAFVTVS